jgi:S-adenosylmethionine-diacylglycerol 3-amino-3-carboxypropyl transferase
VPDAILSRFRYDADYGRGMVDKDRSSIYGGFHLYTFEG